MEHDINDIHSLRTGAVIVAAGTASRMGDFKPMLQLGTISIVERIIANFQQADIFPIVLVTGFRAQELEKHIGKQGVIYVRNENYSQTEMSDSAGIGLGYIQDKCDRTFFTPVDIPLFTVATLNRLMESSAKIIKPVYGGVDGHPVLISCEILPQLIKQGNAEGLDKAMCAYLEETEFISVEDSGILHDVDTPNDYGSVLQYHNRQLLRPVIDVSLMREGKLFDKNSAMLLYMIQHTGNVKDACKKMNISYSKAWNILSELEKNLGFPLVDRKPGGEYGGESQLTEQGSDLLAKYRMYSDGVKKYAQSYFRECFLENQDK